jgi:hypothetical protein
MKAIWTCVLASLALAGSVLAAEPISFRKLPDGDTIEVTFQSFGCFHQAAHALDFARGKEMTVDILSLVPPKRGKALGKITVSDRDLAGLDRLMKFYRSKQPGGCTTVDTIGVVQKHDGKVVAEEKYTDSTCATYDKKDLTLFSALISRLGDKKP